MAKQRNRLVDGVAYVAARSLLFAFAWLPEMIAYPLLDGLGRTFLFLVKSRREISLRNLRQAYGDSKSEPELRRIAYRACGSAFMVLADMAKIGRYVHSGKFMARFDRSHWNERARDFERIANGCPPILCTPHLGSWEAAGIGVAIEFRSIHVIARPLGNPLIDDYVRRTRSLTGCHLWPRRGGVVHLVEGLRSGQAVGTLPDQNQRLRALFVPVFGKLASCDRTQARLSQMTGAPIVVGAAIRLGRRFRFRVAVADMFGVPEASPSADKKTAVDPVYEATCRLHRAVEQLILGAPEQYFWVHDRYRSRPPNEVSATPGEKKSA